MDKNIKLSLKENQVDVINLDKNQKIIIEDYASENKSRISDINSDRNSANILDKIDNKSQNFSLISKISEDEKEKEFFVDTPVKLLLLKIFLLFEGQLIRIFIQIGDIYFSAIITNIYLEVVIIQICASAESNAFMQFYAVLSSLIFSYLMRNICTIAYWELYQLKWLRHNPFESITDLFYMKFTKCMKKNISYVVNIVFGVLFYLFLVGIFSMPENDGKFLDVINFIIFIIIPFGKFIAYYLSYVYICFRDLFKSKKADEVDNECKNPFQYWLLLNNLTVQGETNVGFVTKEENPNKPKGNWVEKYLFHKIVFHIKLCKGKILKLSLQTATKIFFAILSFIYIIYLFCVRGSSIGGVFFLIFLYFFSLIISIQFSTPMWIVNFVYRWYLKIKGKYDRKYQLKCRKLNEKFGLFKVIDLLPVILSISLLVFVLFTMIFFGVSSLYLYDTLEKFNEEGAFKQTNWESDNFEGENNIENIICNSSIYGLSILKISSFPLATYMSGTDNTKAYYEKTFFKEKIENITEMRFLDVYSKYGVVLLVNIDIPNEKPLTIFAIQGSIKKLDWWVDIEIFCSSAIFTFLNAISINSIESLTSRSITWLLTIPLRLLVKFTLFEKYINSLTSLIDKEIEKINGKRNILIAGHSLGGGLSKFLGLKYHKESLAISGPGITPLEYKLRDEIDYKYYKMNFIDVIPDYDVIPRIETTAGIRYRVLCNKGFFGCHSIERTICQIGATCRREDLTGDLCMSIFGEDYYNIRNLAGLKTEVPKEYQK